MVRTDGTSPEPTPMALRFDVEISAGAQPDLYRLLGGIDDGRRRGERLLQLAATGAVWETLRLGKWSAMLHAPPADLGRVPVLNDVIAERTSPAEPASSERLRRMGRRGLFGSG